MNFTPEHIEKIALTIKSNLNTSINDITDLSDRTGIIAINGRIEAARSGREGAGFRIVANEFSKLNDEIADISLRMKEKISEDVQTLIGISNAMARQVRGQRLSQTALSIMDVIDRNLYERTCDVRWWATDPSLTEALGSDIREKREYASRRLGVILDSYTVYLDLFLTDGEGKILASGRPEKHDSLGKNVSDAPWFREARSFQDGGEYSFQSTHASSLVGGEKVLVYACPVENRHREGAKPGVLGIFFNWNGLVQAVLGRVCRLDLREDIEDHRIPTEISIIDARGIVLASTKEEREGRILETPLLDTILASRRSDHGIIEGDRGFTLVAYGYSPGFETYATGWYCVITQEISLD